MQFLWPLFDLFLSLVLIGLFFLRDAKIQTTNPIMLMLLQSFYHGVFGEPNGEVDVVLALKERAPKVKPLSLYDMAKLRINFQTKK